MPKRHQENCRHHWLPPVNTGTYVCEWCGLERFADPLTQTPVWREAVAWLRYERGDDPVGSFSINKTQDYAEHLLRFIDASTHP